MGGGWELKWGAAEVAAVVQAETGPGLGSGSGSKSGVSECWGSAGREAGTKLNILDGLGKGGLGSGGV